MELLKPGFGLIFWTTISFLVFFFLIKKLALKPILSSLKNREDFISNAVNSAKKTEIELKEIQEKNKELLQIAKKERENLLKDADIMKNKLIESAKDEAKKQANLIIVNAEKSIENQRGALVNEIKKLVVDSSVEIAEKILAQKLNDDKEVQKIVDREIESFKI